MPELSGFGVKLRRRDHLLAQVGRGVDQIPVRAVGADRDGGLGTAQLGTVASCFQAHRTSAIPLRNPTACRGAQDDDAKHDPSPGASRLEKYRLGYAGLSYKRLSYKRHEVDTGFGHSSAIGNVSGPEVHLRRIGNALPLTCGWRTYTC